MYPVEFQTQSDVNGRALCDSLMNKVKDMDSYILYAVVSVPVEMSQHLGLLCIMCYLVEVPLEPLFQAVLGRPTYCLPHLVQDIQYLPHRSHRQESHPVKEATKALEQQYPCIGGHTGKRISFSLIGVSRRILRKENRWCAPIPPRPVLP